MHLPQIFMQSAISAVTPEQQLLQLIVTSLLSSGVVGGIIALVTKKSRSPESQNDLARIGNEFAAKLLEQAKSEREELRESIKSLEASNESKEASIARLKGLLEEKEDRIRDLEAHQQRVALKLQRGEPLTLADIFGKDAPQIRLDTHQGVV